MAKLMGKVKIPIFISWGKIRRIIITGLRKKYVKNQLQVRQGGCKQCANCCKLLFRCPWLSKDDKCKIYNSPLRSQVCRTFPLDKRDLNEVFLNSKTICGYNFTNNINCNEAEIQPEPKQIKKDVIVNRVK